MIRLLKSVCFCGITVLSLCYVYVSVIDVYACCMLLKKICHFIESIYIQNPSTKLLAELAGVEDLTFCKLLASEQSTRATDYKELLF